MVDPRKWKLLIGHNDPLNSCLQSQNTHNRRKLRFFQFGLSKQMKAFDWLHPCPIKSKLLVGWEKLPLKPFTFLRSLLAWQHNGFQFGWFYIWWIGCNTLFNANIQIFGKFYGRKEFDTSFHEMFGNAAIYSWYGQLVAKYMMKVQMFICYRELKRISVIFCADFGGAE